MENSEIRREIREAGLKQWQVAEAMGVSERTLVVWLRKPLSKDKRARVERAIQTLTGGAA